MKIANQQPFVVMASLPSALDVSPKGASGQPCRCSTRTLFQLLQVDSLRKKQSKLLKEMLVKKSS